jgi:hypothetical protein
MANQFNNKEFKTENNNNNEQGSENQSQWGRVTKDTMSGSNFTR